MKVITKFNQAGKTWLQQERDRLVQLKAQQSRDYEAMMADVIRLKTLGLHDMADKAWQRAFDFLNNSIMVTAHSINYANQLLSGQDR